MSNAYSQPVVVIKWGGGGADEAQKMEPLSLFKQHLSHNFSKILSSQ